MKNNVNRRLLMLFAYKRENYSGILANHVNYRIKWEILIITRFIGYG